MSKSSDVPSRLTQLEALRDLLWESMAEAPADKRAGLANQYRATLSEIDSLGQAQVKKVDPLDELAARRAARGGSTARPRQAVRRKG